MVALPSPAAGSPPLPGLAVVLDPPAFGALLERHLRVHDASMVVSDVRIFDVQHDGESAAVLVRVNLRSAEFSRTGRQRLFVRIAAPGTELPAPDPHLLARYRERREAAATIDAPMPVGALTLDELGIVVYAYPLDPVLTSLVDVTDPRAVAVALNDLWRSRGVKVRRVQVETLAYTPESRAALRYEVHSESRELGLPEIRHLVGKLQLRKSPARLFAGHWAIWRATLGRIRVAPPVGYLAVAGLSLQEVVRGERLSEVAERGDFVKAVRQAARSIAAIHALELPLVGVRSAETEVRSVRRWLDVLRRIRPQLVARLDRLENRLVAELGARTRTLAPVHSDFHLANVMVDTEGVILIDWDQVAIGDPASDIGRFLGALRVTALRTGGRVDALDDTGAAFLEAYLENRGEDERQIQLFEACGLVVAAASPFRLQREGWEEGAEAMIEAAEGRLAESARRPPAGPPETAKRLAEPERLAWALDPVFSQALLVPPLREAYGDALEILRCYPEQPPSDGAAARLRWRLAGRLGTRPWRTTVEGFALSEHARAGVIRRLGALRDALAAEPEALVLPRPLAHLEPLGMALLEPPAEPTPEPLALPSRDGRAEKAIGRALGVTQRAAVEPGRSHGVEQELGTIGRRIHALAAAGHAAAPELAALLRAAESRLAEGSAPQAIVLRGLHLRKLRRFGDRIGVLALRDVLDGPRPLSLAALLAELAAVTTGDESERALAALRDGWLESSGAPPDELPAFEALALVRRATDEARAEPTAGDLVVRLAAMASRRLAS
jgi:Ser/Thr protein kinase RdoA (MazF antagonist)